MTTVILAEKPSQARSYMDGLGIKHTAKQHRASGSTFLDSNTVVVSAAGHLLELCEPEHYGEKYKDRTDLSVLPIIPSRFDYELPKENKFLFNEITNEISKADTVIVGTDMDNEGGAIAYNILRFSGNLKNKRVLRSYPTALDKKAVLRQFKNLKPIEKTWNDAHAAIARSQSDWLIGMNLSRFYTTKLAEIGIIGNFAVGRAISTTLNLICQWQESIDSFKEEPIYELNGKIDSNKGEILLKSKIREVGKENKGKFISVLKQAGVSKKKTFGRVALTESKVKLAYPSVMFTKGDLYKEMSRVAGWKQAKSKKVMQKNYDMGYQTYQRTDAPEIPKQQYDYMFELFDQFMDVIGEKGKFKKFSMPEKQLKRYLAKSTDTDAHYGIMPTEKIMDSNAKVTADQRLMYEVVVRKALTLVTQPYKYVANKLGVLVNKVPLVAQNTGTLELGWRGLKLPNKIRKKKKTNSPQATFDYSKEFQKGDKVLVNLSIDVGKTKPPHALKSIQIYDKGGIMERAYKYVENQKYASILKKVKGIGTSATRDQAMASLVQKDYIAIDSKDTITVTSKGWLINHLLQGSKVNDPILTAKWEEKYVEIEKGIFKANELVSRTAGLIQDEMDNAKEHWNTEAVITYYQKKNEKYSKKVSLGQCPICGSDVTFKRDYKNNGKWDAYRCSNKDCKFIIWKHYSNRSISENDVRDLLEGKPTRKFSNLKSKYGSYFDARLILKRDDTAGTYKLRVYTHPNSDSRYN